MIAKPDAIKFNTQVTAIESNIEINSTVTAEITVKTKDTTTHKPMHDGNYLTVLNSTTLGSINRMDLSKTGLFWDMKQAIRCLGYGASCKVGMKFKTAWWRGAPYNIRKGGLAHTDFPLQVCVYPSYNVDDPVNEPIVLLVSYTWGQTAQRLASLIPSCNDDSSAQEELRNVLIHDLTLLTAQDPTDAESYKVTRERIAGDLVETHGYDWYRDPHMAGVFAFFGPCQFWDLYIRQSRSPTRSVSCILSVRRPRATKRGSWVHLRASCAPCGSCLTVYTRAARRTGGVAWTAAKASRRMRRPRSCCKTVRQTLRNFRCHLTPCPWNCRSVAKTRRRGRLTS